MKALFVGNLTIDIIENVYRVGGSGFYGGRALAEGFEIEVHILTNVSKRYRDIVLKTLTIYGVKVIEIESEIMPLFAISKGKAKEFYGGSPMIPINAIENHIKSLNPEIVLMTPIMNELDPDSISVVRQWFKGILSVDIQGFVRTLSNKEIRCAWVKGLEEKMVLADIVHGNLEEFCFTSSEIDVLKRIVDLSTVSRATYLVSLDQRGTYAVHKGEAFYIPALPVKPVDDVGAGDVLLATASYYRAIGEHIVKAIVKAVVAASLKVGNAYTRWFKVDDIESIYRELMEKIKVVNI